MYRYDDIYNNDIKMRLDYVTDWAIHARASDMMLSHPGMTEDDAIRCALDDENADFKYAMSKIHEGKFDNVDAVRIFDDKTFVMDDDWYTDEHMVEIKEALEEALAEDYVDTYEKEKEMTWRVR